MTIDQAISQLMQEKKSQIGSRFPCRAIMVKNIKQYCELLSKLNSISDVRIVKADELFKSADIMPRYENLKSDAYRDEWIILPGVSEYLRLFGKNEAESQRFAKLWNMQRAAYSTGRIIIPLWGCEAQWHDKAIHLCDDIRQDDFYMDCVSDEANDQNYRILVLSGAFEQYISELENHSGRMLIGLRDWYDYWIFPNPNETRHLLLTDRINGVQPTVGTINISVIRDTLSFVVENIKGGNQLTSENCPPAAQEALFGAALKRETLERAILNALNINTFSGADVTQKWEALSLGQKQLVFLWFEINPDDTYLSCCVTKSDSVEELATHILYDIFDLRFHHPSWIEESQRLIGLLNIKKDSRYYELVDMVPNYEERLGYLKGGSKEDQIYILHLIGKWLRQEGKQGINSELLEEIFPALCSYLNDESAVSDSDFTRYMGLYKTHKLENTLPNDEICFFSGYSSEAYDYRYSVLTEYVNEDTAILWVDALGAEWLSLLLWSLNRCCVGKVSGVRLVQATLPTETEFNNHWTKMSNSYKKLDSLDKLAHKGVIDEPDYYACILEQFNFISSLGEKVNELLKDYSRVIITGDHGTSRLAARFFHERQGIPVPAGVSLGSHGRYCKIDSGAKVNSYANQIASKDSEGNNYLCFTNYDHYVQSGFATGASDETATYGEIHGGATPEEVLVPVVVIDTKTKKKTKADWKDATVKVSSKKVVVYLEFNRLVQKVQLSIGTISASCELVDAKKWKATFAGISPGKYTVNLVADGELVTLPELTVLPALGGGIGDL